MDRRDFIAASLAAAGLNAAQAGPVAGYRFSPCLNEVTTLSAPFPQDCVAYQEAGFRHIELWFDKLREQNLKPAEVNAMLRDHDLAPVSACASEGGLWRGQGPLEPKLTELERSFELAQALNVPRYVVFSYVSGDVTPDDQHEAAARLAREAELAAKYKVRIALEFICRSALLGSLETTLQVLREGRQQNAGVCLDVHHFFAGISKFEDLDDLRPGDIEHVHFHDLPGGKPRELLTEPDRLPPGEGIVPLRRITAALARIRYSGNLSTELFGDQFTKGDPRSVARRCFQALGPYCASGDAQP
jgi:2-keto-myo-inositol isomerase